MKENSKAEMDDFAGLMVAAYRLAAADARLFMAEHGSPTTTMDKAHRLRSLIQAGVTQSDRFRLHPEYMEFGRVQFTDVQTSATRVLRSRSAVAVEKDARFDGQYMLFPEPQRVGGRGLPQLLVYEFDRTGLSAWMCATRREGRSTRLIPASDLGWIGFWPFDTPGGSGGDGGGQFDQGPQDPFGDLGNPDIGEAGGL
ncbi:hypothetical protein [Williamsia sp. M5A3_1d]